MSDQGQEQRAARAPGAATPLDRLLDTLVVGMEPHPGLVTEAAGELADLRKLMSGAVHGRTAPTNRAEAAEAAVAMVEEENDALREELRVARETASALEHLMSVINAAGLLNLSNGVQLGATSWYVKASDAMAWAAQALEAAKSGGKPRRDDDPAPGADPAFTGYVQDKWAGRLDDQHDDVRDDYAPDGLAVRP